MRGANPNIRRFRYDRLEPAKVLGVSHSAPAWGGIVVENRVNLSPGCLDQCTRGTCELKR
jgi:hypothetical protein